MFYPLAIEAYIGSNGSIGTIQEEIATMLRGLCGAPCEREIQVSVTTGRVSILWQNFLAKDIPTIRARLELCRGLRDGSITITETRTISH